MVTGIWSVRTVLAIQVRNAQDVELAADGRREGATDRGLAGDELADAGGARADGGGGCEAHESSEGGECKLHREWCGGGVVLEEI